MGREAVRALVAAMVVGLPATGAAQAGDPAAQAYPPAAAPAAVVVELYTSQGCSACPPVDSFFADLAARDDVIALALHVDYWDYIGWRDSFARPAHTERQKAYARAAGSRTIYTPQIVVAGNGQVAGFRPMQVLELIEAARRHAAGLQLRLERSGPRLAIEAEGDGRPLPAVVVQLVRYVPARTVSIERGENAGRTLTYRNIVTDWSEIARWDGRGRWRGEAEAAGEEPVVVILQAEGQGPILAAARLR